MNLSIKGLSAFQEQAEKAKAFFSKRQQTIRSFYHNGIQTEIEIDYHAILAIDFSNELKKKEIRLTCKANLFLPLMIQKLLP